MPNHERPRIIKLGSVDADMVETTPVVFRDTLYRFEYVRTTYWANKTGNSHFRFVEWNTGRPGAPFAAGYHLGNVLAEGDVLYVTATNAWGGDRIDLFRSRDMERWERWNALTLPGYGLYNTSLCRSDHGYTLMFEVGEPPEVAGVRFTARFARSTDLKHWELTPRECCYARDRYTAPHSLRYLEGYYYNFYLESLPEGFHQHVVRSTDLVHWESSPLNPVLQPSARDRKPARSDLPPWMLERFRTAENRNNSDIDFCEYRGSVVITYSWGNQRGVEHLALARYDGTLKEFLLGWFPR